MITVHACTMVMVHVCTMIIVHACTMIIVHACTMIMVHACNMITAHARIMIMLLDGDSSPWFTMHHDFKESAYLPRRIFILARIVHTSHTKSYFSQKTPPLPHKLHVAMPSQRSQICSIYEKLHTSHVILMFFQIQTKLTHTHART